jgi:hypothetical protein
VRHTRSMPNRFCEYFDSLVGTDTFTIHHTEI